MLDKVDFIHLDNGELEDFITTAAEYKQFLMELLYEKHVTAYLNHRHYREVDHLGQLAMSELAKRLKPKDEEKE